VFERAASWIVKRKRDVIAKKVRRALLNIPFYREKVKQNSIPFYEVKRINSIEKLEKFLQKYKVCWVKSEDLVGSDFSSHLSLASRNKRTWVQYSSGYTLIEKLRCGENFWESVRKFRRKKVAFTDADLKLVLNGVYLNGLRRVFPKNFIPKISIFARMYIFGGSGTYPFASLLMLLKKFPLIVLPYGEPLSREQLYDHVLDSMENDTNGIITAPSILEEIGEFMVENKLRYENLRYVGMGGLKPTKEIVNLGHEIGAQLIIDAYSVQECMPLGCIASGTISSEDKSWEATEGLMVLGNLCHVRIVDKNGENVDEGEEGEIRITSPFEGTTLIDYAPGDVTSLLHSNNVVEFKGWRINIPYPLLSWDIRRKDENPSVRIREHPMSMNILSEILSSHLGYDFVILKPTTADELLLLIPNNIGENTYEEICQKIRYVVPHPLFYDLVKVKKIDEAKLREIVYPSFHHKPHNVILSPSKKLEDEISAL